MILGTIHSARLDWPWRILLQDHKSFLVNANPYTLYNICNSERILVVPWELLHHTPHILYSYEHPNFGLIYVARRWLCVIFTH